MKHLLFWMLTTFCATGVVRAESYRIYYLLISPKYYAANGFPSFLKDEATFRSALSGDDGVIVKGMLSVKLNANGVGELDQTRPISYPQSYAANGTPQEFTQRNVGGKVRLEKQANSQIRIRCAFTELEHWIFYGPEKQFLQPIFNTREITQGVASSTGFAPQPLGGGGPSTETSSDEKGITISKSDEKPGWFFVIQQIPDSLVFTQ